MLENKKLALLRILQILWEHSNEKNPMTQSDLLKRLKADYGIEGDRRMVGRNISLLKEAGFDIESDRRGSWLAEDARPFTEGELLLLTDSILSSYYIPREQTSEIINKLSALADAEVCSRIRKRSTIDAWEKTESKLLFYNIELITEAIEQGRQIRFQYMTHGVDKKLHLSYETEVTPCRILVRENRCSMISISDFRHNAVGGVPVWVDNYYVERMQNIEILPKKGVDPSLSPVFAHGFSMEDLRRAYPNCRPIPLDEPKLIRFTMACTESLIDDLLETFGTDIKIERMGTLRGEPIEDEVWNLIDANDHIVRVTMTAVDSAVWQFIKEHSALAVVLSPEGFTERYIQISRSALDVMEQFLHNARCTENGT